MTDPTAPVSRKFPAENVDSLRAKLDDKNKAIARAIKRLTAKGETEAAASLKPIAYSFGPLFSEKNPKGADLPDRVYSIVTVTAEVPKAGEYEFVAALTHVDGVGTVLRVVPGANVAEGELARYREASPDNCDHCNAKRQRKDTFILRRVQA